MNYYKATRPDGRDFQTGTIDYGAALLSGEVVRHPTSKKMVATKPGTYLSVSVSASDCTGFSWPCRLFRVEPEGEVLDGLDASRNKRAVLALRVVEELPAWQAFGPNGESVVRLINAASRITTEQATKLAAAWDAAWAGAAAGDAAGAAAGAAALDAAWAAAGAAARDAAWALVSRDLITPKQFDTLTGPWVSVMGPLE